MKTITRFCQFCNKPFTVTRRSEAAYCCIGHAKQARIIKMQKIGKGYDTKNARAAYNELSRAKQAATMKIVCARKRAGMKAWEARCRKAQAMAVEVSTTVKDHGLP